MEQTPRNEGERILSREEVDGHPYVSLTPIPVPHKFYGLSLADITMDLQLIKSTLWRNMLDNYYMLNNGRYVMVEGQVNLDDLLTSRPGGVIREKVPGAVRRLDQPQLPNSSFTMLEYIDKVRDERSGVRVFQGLDADTLQHTTATAYFPHSTRWRVIFWVWPPHVSGRKIGNPVRRSLWKKKRQSPPTTTLPKGETA